MEHDAWFFVGVFVFIFLIWVATGGPMHPIAFSGPQLAQPQELGGGTYLQLPRATLGIGTSNVVLPGSSSGDSSYYNNSAPQSSGGGTGFSIIGPTGSGGTYSVPSDYRNMVSLQSYVSSASSSDPRQEYVQVSVAQNASGPVTLTGWSLQSGATAKAEVIPQGTPVPSSGVVNASQDIVLRPGESALIISGKSPVGASFRENKCIGYFSGFQKFSPSLPSSCPAPDAELKRYYGDSYIHDPACIDYVDTLSRCQVPLTKAPKLTDSCESILVKYLNYNGCVQSHGNDSDFNGTTWRIYLGRTTHMWRAKHEIVKLIDDRGKLVASFTY